MTKERVYIDGIESVSLTEGMIRMELYNLQPRAGEDGKVGHLDSGELIMSPQSFMKAFGAMENLINQLIEAGVVKRNL